MRARIAGRLMMLLATLVFSGCGFGGFNDQSTGNGYTGAPDTDTTISGVVSKGMFHEGTVEIYAIGPSGEETLLKSASIGAFGNYSATLGSSQQGSGVVVIKAYGRYLDEATGAELSVLKESPLRAAVANPPGEVLAMVTPLTELAVRRAFGTGNTLAAADVASANALVSQLFKVDIVATEPVRPDLSASGFGNAATSQEQKDYTLALATVSQLARDSGTLSDALGILGQSVSSGGGSSEGALAFRRSLSTFLSSDRNHTGVSDPNSTNLTGVGGSSREVTLSFAGTLDPGVLITGATLTLELPAGVTVKGDFTDPSATAFVTLEGVVKASAAASLTMASYLPATGTLPGRVRMSLANAGGLQLGEFATVRCEVPPGAPPQAGDFTVSGFVAYGYGEKLPNVDVERPPKIK